MNWLRFSVLILLNTLLVSCSKFGAQYALAPEQNTFRQSATAVSNKLDILWVVDNSSSMGDDQQNLANNFKSFISSFVLKKYDFQLAVVPTDSYKGAFLGNPDTARFRGKDGTTSPAVSVITPLFENAIEIFQDNVLQGAMGSGDERAFQSMHYSLSSDLNSGFVRENSFLAIIIVSDEDDFSHDSSEAVAEYDNPNLHSISQYVSFLSDLTGSTPSIRRFSVSAMAIFDESCLGANEYGYLGIRYKEMIDATGGILGSICDDFSSTLNAIQNRIAELSTQFYLSREPRQESIVVAVDGTPVPRDLLNGWSYSSESNSIVFHGSYIPAQDSIIKVNFDPLAAK
ncbi:MAG: hypothetical protein COT74_00785 [Bdellovibrionales bacterium CG10_big_fil_rev_8_21_14_0_10_45_34]|nr:MAG: hypothetical protein COT74_00785 [Bdellovibrionales bacterium CG10_big_fil_rev_8_21_14_0_10_45_34]